MPYVIYLSSVFTPYSTNDGKEVDLMTNIPESPPTSGTIKVSDSLYIYIYILYIASINNFECIHFCGRSSLIKHVPRTSIYPRILISHAYMHQKVPEVIKTFIKLS